MSWSARSRDPAGPTDSANESVQMLRVEHHSPGLEVALGIASERESVRVLDLGPAVAANLDFLSAFARHVRFVDLLGDGGPISELGEFEGQELRRRVREILPSDWGVYDLVLAWDLINYLDEVRVESIVERLRALSHGGTVLFAMIATTREIPARPLTYTIADRSTVTAGGDDPAAVVECPRRPPAAVERLLSGFSVERSYLLRHGVQEYVAVRQ